MCCMLFHKLWIFKSSSVCLFPFYTTMRRSMCVYTRTYIGCNGAGKAMSSDSFAVSEYVKKITIELLRVARKLSAFGPNRLDEINYLEG